MTSGQTYKLVTNTCILLSPRPTTNYCNESSRTPTTNMSQPIIKSSPIDPLIGAKATSNQDPKPIPSSSALVINTLALGRIGLGIASFVAPTLTFSLFKIAIPANMTPLARMFGGRELVIGEWTWMINHEDRNVGDGGRRELKRTMRLNTVVDALDFAAVGYGVATGTLGRLPAGLLAGGALTCVAMDLWGLRGL
ncbi:hypothetical protein P171DRAFT_427611 [Karstenula rhodostoma CBS 690.94]|uniref:DUF4267 domain-containing protein n=1 Tax=Karstenula rhodostoma CBS 690.94 TaxID=1392251 RepID=A0A9P4PS48_9PLEO|nr:hypothetical protein P171DRAFT_427611 [Karstenula rhodostoma CBS 690.94]